MAARCSPISSLALLVLLSTVRAGPFAPRTRTNGTRSALRPPPQPGGLVVEPGGRSPSSQLYEHTVEGGEKQVVFTHRINLPPSAGCGCPPGTEPPAPASDVQALKVRLEMLEELVRGLKEQCSGGCCPATAQAGTGQTDIRSLCSLHGVFDLSRCACSCEPGWGGATCSDPTDAEVSPSSPPSDSCPDDCNDQGRCVDGRCVCFPGYAGPSCGWPSCPGDCQGRGRCVQGVCVCRPGFSGDDCSQRACPRGCSQRGRCEDGRCVCDPGYSGEDCRVRSCPRGCSQRGRCENGRCVCNPGYSGEDCSVRSCPRGCSQKGRCEDGRCVCDPGYTGEDCGTRTCPWDCGEGGRCVDGRCVCWPGYAGDDCSARTCPQDCHGRGRCEDGECICDAGYSGDDCSVRSCPGDCNQRGHCEDGRCVCWPGYTGPDCSARACPRDCRGRGRCENGVCVCNAGYSGEDCGVRSCPGDCRGRGRCENGRCVCWPGYTGRDCGTRACPGDCRGRGRCVDGRCVCNPGFAGDDCGSRRCPGDCRGRGRCDDGVCVCDAGYEGEDCGMRSCPAGCRGRGQCLDGRCVCDDGYEGEDCGVQRCPRDCHQRGVCQDGVCACWEGYAGEDCGVRTCPSNCHGRGRCVDGRCVCDPGYTGPACATRTCPSDCRGRGRCVQGVCVCHAGYSGEDCGQDAPPSSACPGGCGPRELCRNGQCVCVEGFRGPDCAIQTCPGDCLGRGECREGSCVCRDGYAGEDCGEEIPAIDSMRLQLVEETTVRTEWTRGPGTVDAYEIQFIPTTEGVSPPFTARVPSSASAYDQRGLAPGQEYQVIVRALRGTSWGPPVSKTITTMIDGPQDLRVVAVTPTTLDLSWLRPQAEVDRFVVSYVSAGNQRVRLEVPSEADGTQLTGLMPGVEYVVTVTAERGPAVSYPSSVRANTGSSPLDVLETTDEPPPSGPPTTQGVRAPDLQQRPQELGELKVLGKDKTGHLHVVWTAQSDIFTHFQLNLRVPGSPDVYEELLPGDVRQALIPSPRPGDAYELTLRGVLPSGEPSAPLTYYGNMDPSEEKPGRPQAPPRLGELTVSDVTSDSLLLHWTVPEGEFDSFLIQYKDRSGPQLVPMKGSQRETRITNLDLGRKYKFTLYGLVGKKKQDSLVAEVKIVPQTDSSPATPPRLGQLWVTDPSPDSLRLSWTVPEGQFDSFLVQYKDRAGRPQVVPVEGPERSVIISPLDPDHKYRFSLFGIANKKRHGPLMADGTTAPETAPQRPGTLERPVLGQLTVVETTPDSARLYWTVAKGPFDSFLVQYKDAQGRLREVPVRGDENEVTIPDLEAGRKYKMDLYGLRGGQRMGPVSVVAAIAPPETGVKTPSTTEASMEPPEEPVLGALTVSGSSPDSLSLSWTVPQGRFDTFTVQYKDRDGRPQLVRVGGEEREVTVQGLEPGRKYKMNLYGVHEGRRVGPVSTVGVTEESPPATESPLEPQLGELIVTDVTPNSVDLAWTVAEGQFDSFVVQYKDKDGLPQMVPVAQDQLEVTVPGLEPGRKYRMNLYGLSDGQRVGPLSVVAVTAPLPPTAAAESPQQPLLGELTVTSVTPDSVGLSWTVPQGEFDSFVVQYKDRAGQLQLVPVDADQREVIVPGLEPGKKYKFLLFGIQEGKRSSPVSVEAKTEPQSDATGKPPRKPRLGEELKVTSVTPDTVGLSWTVPEGQFDSFVVQYKDRNGQPQAVPVEGDLREVTIPGLDPARRYKMLLYGLYQGKRVGPLSTTVVTAETEAEPLTQSPAAPEPQLGELTVEEVTPHSVHLSWTEAEGPFDSYVVQYTDQDGQQRTIHVEGDRRDLLVPHLEPDHRYLMELYGIQGRKHVGPAQVEALTAPREEEPSEPGPPTAIAEPPSKPRLGELMVTDATPESLSLSWTVPEGRFDHFLVQYKNGDGQPKALRVPGHQNRVTISGLEPDHKYKMNLFGFHSGQRVGPVSAIGATEEENPTETESTPSPAEAIKEPPEEPVLGALTVTGSSPDSLRLSWTVPQGRFNTFTVQYKDRDGRPQLVRVGGEEREVTVQGLEPGRKYKMNLYGVHEGRRVGPVSTVGVTAETEAEPLTQSPAAPEPQLGELTVEEVTPHSVHLSWTEAEGPFDSYVVQYTDQDGQQRTIHVEGDRRDLLVPHLEPDHRYLMELYGIQGRKHVGPAQVEALTAPREEEPSEPGPPTAIAEPPSKPRLGELMVTDATPESLSLSWTVPEGRFDHFLVQYKNGDGQPKALRVPGHQNRVTISGLEPDHKYKMNLFGFHSGQRVGPVSAIGATVSEEEPPTETESTPSPEEAIKEPPEEPVLGALTVIGSSPDSLSLSWTIPQGRFDTFTVQYKDRDGRPQLVRVGGEEREVTVQGLEPGRKYKMNLYGVHEGRRMGPMSTVGVTASEEDSDSLKPRLGEVTVTDATPESLSLAWTVPEGRFDHFLVQYKNGDGQPKVVRVPGDQDKVTISGLEPDHKYKMNLYGFHGDQREGPISTVGSTTPDHEVKTTTAATTTPPPSKPRLGELTVTDATPESLSLSWTVPEGDFDHFLVQYKNGDGQPKALRVPGHQNRVTISGLEPDHKYKMNLFGFHSGQRVGPVSVIGATISEEETPTETESTPSPAEVNTEAPEEPVLGALTVSGSSPDSLSLSWTVPQGRFDTFTVQYKDRDGRPQLVRVGGEEREVTVQGLEPGRKYKMNLYGVHEGRRVGPVSTVGMTDSQKTPAPTETSTEPPEVPEEPVLGTLTVTGSSPDSLSLSWTVPQGRFDTFIIQYKDTDGRPQVVRVGGEEREVTVQGLEPGRKYKMNLYGVHEGRRVGPVSTVGVTAPDHEVKTTTAATTTPPPSKPRLGELTVTDATPESLSLSWTVPEGDFDHFLVQYKNGDGQPKALRVPGHQNRVTISGLEPDHKYKMNLFGFHSGQRVGPVSAIGATISEEETPTETESTPSPAEVSTEPPEEPVLGALTVTGSSPDSLSLSWTVPQGHFDTFTVQYKDRDGRPQLVRVGGEEREVTVQGLEPGRKYKMNLYGVHEGRRVGPMSTVGVTAPLPTEPPVTPRLGELAVAAVTSDTVRLSWTVAQDPFDSFLVQYRGAQGQLQTLPVRGDLRELTVSGLDPARKYKFLLFGLQDERKHGPVSAEAKTLPARKPSPVLGELTVTSVTPDSVGLSWTVPQGEFDSFVVQYKDRAGQPQLVPVAADQREVIVPGLEPGKKYKFLLYGQAGRKRLGPVSAEGTTAALEEPPPPPRLGELTVSGETPDSVLLSWTVPQGPFDSFLVQFPDASGRPRTVPAAADQREITIAGLEPGRRYTFMLYGLLGGQHLGPISAQGVTAPREARPETPEPAEGPRLGELVVGDVAPHSLRLSWTVAQGPFDSFVVQYPGANGKPQALLVAGNQNKVLVSNLEPSTSYRFLLYGLRDGKRLGPISAEGTTGPAPPGQTPEELGPRLSQLSVTDVTTSSLRLNWEAPPGAFDSFLLRYGVPASSPLDPYPRPLLQRELKVGGGQRSAVLRDLNPGTLYSVTLYGLRGPHKADSVQGTARTLSPVLESPRDLQVSEIRETSANVSWTPPLSQVDSFKVSYQLADGGEPQSIQVDGRTQSQVLQGLTPGATYQVTVVSVRGFEESEPLTGTFNTVSDGPTNLHVVNLTDDSAILVWNKPSTPVDKFDVQVTASENEDSQVPTLKDSAPGSAANYSLSGLERHTNYTATVWGLRGDNITSPASVNFTTGLEAARDLKAKEVTPRTALLTWAEPQDPPTGYLLSFDTPGGETQEILLPGSVTSYQLQGLFPSTLYNAWLRAVWGESFTPPVTTSFTTGGLRVPFPRDCGEEMQNGPGASRATTIFLNGNRERPLNVFCDMETDGGGWLVFQRRMDGKTDFWRDWEEYAHGFGNVSREFWLGNEALHSLTKAGDYSLRVDLRAGDEAVFAQYDSFRVDSAAQYYRLHVEGYHGTAGDSLSYHSGSVFSARDRDPNNLLISCAVSYRGAWWYRNCHYANLNGLYGSTVDHQGVSWYYWKGFEFSVPFTEMKLRPRNYQPPAQGD
ncbi:tenascin-X [Sorex araneus]|uniref:tenascin-X n=1 Tax=Sorex araneus TaxID=42254 RepID=UPI00243365DF|nr:tenascin-X [Sorex araneus]